jgi:transcriptional regulator GlxA family with amidase domain
MHTANSYFHLSLDLAFLPNIDMQVSTGYTYKTSVGGVVSTLILKAPQTSSNSPYMRAANDLRPDKLIEVINYIKENHNKHITLTQVANIAGMTAQSFCRFFKKERKRTIHNI